MITFWPDGKKANEFVYELRSDEGFLIYRILNGLSPEYLVERGFTEEEINKINSIYSSF